MKNEEMTLVRTEPSAEAEALFMKRVEALVSEAIAEGPGVIHRLFPAGAFETEQQAALLMLLRELDRPRAGYGDDDGTTPTNCGVSTTHYDDRGDKCNLPCAQGPGHLLSHKCRLGHFFN